MSNNFSFYTGIAVEDKVLKSRELKVYVRELLPFVGGKLKDTSRDEKYTMTDQSGAAVSGNVNTTNCITAEFFGLDTNNTFTPDICKGEQVIVLRYADEDKYYWMSSGRDDNLRRGEIIRWAASNDMAIEKELGEENTYFAEVDTRIAKRIRLHTSKSDGEAYGYDLIIDASNNFITIRDDSGNRIDLESKEKRIKLTTAAGTTVNLDNENIFMLAPKVITIRAGVELIMVAPQIKRKGDVESIGDINNLGNTTDTGALRHVGSIANTGNVSNTGSVTNSGTISSSGNVTAPIFVGSLRGGHV